MSTVPLAHASPVASRMRALAAVRFSRRVKLTVEPLRPRDWQRWDGYVHSHDDGSIYHTVGWMLSVRDAFGHRPCYKLLRRDGVLAGVLPMFCVDSRLGGRRFISVPYGVDGGVLADDDAVADCLLEHVVRQGARTGAVTVEFRSSRRRYAQLTPVDSYVTFRRQLPESADDVLAWLPRKARAAARNAECKHRLTTEFSPRWLRTVWRLYARSMRRLGSLAYPYRFIEQIWDRHRRCAFVQIVRFGNRPIAGLLSLRYNDTFVPYIAGCDERYNRCGTNNYLYMTAMRQAVRIGCRVFDFGRTRIDNRGSYDFKRFCGFTPQPMGYQRWVHPDRECRDLSPSNPSMQLYRRIWRHLPQWMCNVAGGRLARHIPG